jgi:hypothetical protein
MLVGGCWTWLWRCIFDLELHGFDDEVCSVRGVNKWEHVLSKLLFECLSNVWCHKSLDSCRYAKGPEF